LRNPYFIQMKKIYILPALLLAGGTLMAQNNIQSFRDMVNTPAPVNMNQITDASVAPEMLSQQEPANAPVAASVSVYDGVLETVIGTSNYDLQTNNSVQNRLVDLGGGKMAAVWTMSDEDGPAFANRGTGYNYFDGSDWADQPDERIESKRTGWPSIVVMGNGTEAFLAHSTDEDSPANVFGTRTTPGTGEWTLGTINDGENDLEYTWNRMVTGGTDNNTLHVIGHREFPELVTDENTVGYISYSRSTDGGATWDIVDTILADIDSTLYTPFGGDGYSITSDGNTVAFVCGGGDRDVILMKSEDNGISWTKSIIWSFPIAKFDPLVHLIDTADRVNTSDGSYAISLDDDGDAHVFFGNYYIANDDITTAGTSWYPLTDGLFHWEESYGVADTANAFQQFDTLAMSVDSAFLSTITGIENVASYFSGVSSYPSSTVDANGDIYVTYSACVTTGLYEDQIGAGEEFERVYRHQYIVRSVDNGATWSEPRDLMAELIQNTEEVFYEGVYGTIMIQDGFIYVMYQRDDIPGIHIQPADNNPHEVTENDIVVVKVATADFNVIGINEVSTLGNATVYPNPAANEVNVRFDLDQAQTSTVAIVNMVGQTVLAKNVEANLSNNVTMNVSSLTSGVYFVEITAGNSTITEKLVIK